MKDTFERVVKAADSLASKFYKATDYQTAQKGTAVAIIAPFMIAAAVVSSPALALVGFIGGAVAGTSLGRKAHTHYNKNTPS